MSNPIFKQGSIFGMNKPVSASPAQPQKIKSGSIFGNQSIGFQNTNQGQTGPVRSSPNKGAFVQKQGGSQSVSPGKSKKPQITNKPIGLDTQNVRKPLAGKINVRNRSPGTPNVRNPSSKTPSDKSSSQGTPIVRNFSPGTPNVRNPSPNMRQNFKPKTQKVGTQEFQTWNKNEMFPNTKANQLMDRAQSAFVRQPPQASNLTLSPFIGSGRSPYKPKNRVPSSDSDRPAINPQRTKISKPCRFFMLGKCAKGDDCLYEHKSPNASPNSSQNSAQIHKTWVKPKKQEASAEEASIEMDEESQANQDSESEEIDDEDGVSPMPPIVNANKGKNLRSMLNKIRENRPATNQPEESSSNNESEEAYNSDTFGNVKQPKFQGIRKKEEPTMIYHSRGSREELKEEERLSNIDSVGEEEENIDIPVQKISVPSDLIKISDENPFNKIQQIILKAESEKNSGRNPSIATDKAQLVRM